MTNRPEQEQMSTRPFDDNGNPIINHGQFTIQCAVAEGRGQIDAQIKAGNRYINHFFVGGGEVVMVFEK